jgi:hypothetical protein
MECIEADIGMDRLAGKALGKQAGISEGCQAKMQAGIAEGMHRGRHVQRQVTYKTVVLQLCQASMPTGKQKLKKFCRFWLES